MARQVRRISDLPEAGPLTGDELIELVQDGENKRVSALELSGGAAPVQSVQGRTGDVVITAEDVGLGNVDNTSDADKPVSTAQQAALDGKVDALAGMGLSSNDFTDPLRDKLIGLEGTHWRGTFVSLAALQAGVTDPAAGDYADVDSVGDDVERYIWDATDGIWVAQSGEVAPITASQVKLLYESNPDTNAFTDADEAKLGELNSATATQAEAEAGTSTVTRQWTPQRVRQAIVAWWNSITSVWGRGFVSSADAAAGRTALGLGTAATRNVGTGSGNVMEVGAFGLGKSGDPGVSPLSTTVTQGIFGVSSGDPDWPFVGGTYGGSFIVSRYGGQFVSQLFFWPQANRMSFRGSSDNGVSWRPWTELHNTGNILSATGQSPTFPMTQKAVTDALNTKMDVGAGGWLSQASPNSYISGYPQDISQNVSQIYRRDSVDEGVSAFASSIHFAANDTWGRLRVGHNNQRAWIQGGTDLGGTGWTAELYHTGNTTVDSNGFLKDASPIIKLHSDRMETEADGAFERLGTGRYRLAGCNGLRLTDGWYIETPHDRNKVPYFNVEWDQDHEPDAEAGVLDEPADVTLTIRCYERVWNPQTGQYDNGDPVDIPEGRWIDLRMNEVRQPEPEMPEAPDEPELQPETPAEPVIPSVVTMAQAKLALLYAGLYEQAEAFINELPEPQKTAALIEWNHRQTLEREHPLVGQVADGLGLTEQQLDELFLDASTR